MTKKSLNLIGPAQQLGAIGDSITNMINRLLPLNEGDGVMIIIAA